MLKSFSIPFFSKSLQFLFLFLSNMSFLKRMLSRSTKSCISRVFIQILCFNCSYMWFEIFNLLLFFWFSCFFSSSTLLAVSNRINPKSCVFLTFMKNRIVNFKIVTTNVQLSSSRTVGALNVEICFRIRSKSKALWRLFLLGWINCLCFFQIKVKSAFTFFNASKFSISAFLIVWLFLKIIL